MPASQSASDRAVEDVQERQEVTVAWPWWTASRRRQRLRLKVCMLAGTKLL